MSYWIALIIAIAGNVGANIAFKQFMQNTELKRSWASVGVAFAQPSFLIGCSLGFVLLGTYLYAIKGIPLSTAYTVATSVSIAGVTAAGVLIFGETISLRAAIGIAVVLLGVALITAGQSAQ